MDRAELVSKLDEFVQWRWNYLTGDEKGEAQIFLDHLFQAFGHEGSRQAGAVPETRIRRRQTRRVSFADLVWQPRALIEMKKAEEHLERHYEQAFDYWLNLTPSKPDYVVLCNFDEFWIYDLNRQLDIPVDRVALDDLPRRWEALGFMLPDPVDPAFGNDVVEVTRDAAATVARVTNAMIDRGVERGAAQRFVMQSVVAMFAEDIGLLPTHLFTKALEDSTGPGSAYDLLFGLFNEMNRPGDTPAGRYQGTPYFNGSLFATVDPVDLTVEEVHALHEAATHDWTAVRPEIFGTLFEQSLESDARRAYGAHFTSGADIQRIVRPCIVTPFRERIESASTQRELGAIESDLLSYRVLDPACGCGNFLYIAYREMRKLEALIEERRAAMSEARAPRPARLSLVSPTQFFGMDIDRFAVEIAKVTLLLAKQLAAREVGDIDNPLPLDNLDDNFLAADAVLEPWPAADIIIGNPPYLGRRQLIEHRGADYASQISEHHPGVTGVSDYVVYWFQIAHDQLPAHGRAGLVATNSIRHGDSRRCGPDYVIDNGGKIIDAWSSIPWSGEANVHVSIINWTKTDQGETAVLRIGDDDDQRRIELDDIAGHLEDRLDVTSAADLQINRRPKTLHQGQTAGHAGYVLDAGIAHRLLATPGASDVVHPYLDGHEMLRLRAPERFVIDFPQDDIVAARAAAPDVFTYLEPLVMAERERRAREEADGNAEALERNPSARVNWHHRNFFSRWWQLSYRRAQLMDLIASMDRFIAVPAVASNERNPVFEFIAADVHPSHALQCLVADDDYSFGIVQSGVHAAWLRARCSRLKSDPRYTTKTIWHSFPWPQEPDDDAIRDVVTAVEHVLDYRAERIDDGMTLVELYDTLRLPGRNQLRRLHGELDAAVINAYGFDNSDPLRQLLDLNQELAVAEHAGQPVSGPGASWIPAAARRRTNYRLG